MTNPQRRVQVRMFNRIGGTSPALARRVERAERLGDRMAKRRKKTVPDGVPDLTPERRRGGLLDANPLGHITHLPRTPLSDRREGREIHRAKLIEWYRANGEPDTVILDGAEVPMPPYLLRIMNNVNHQKGPRR